MTAPSSVTRTDTKAVLSCMLCSRVIGHATGTQRRVDALIRAAKRQLACPYCGGALLVSDIEQCLVIDCRPLTEEEMTPKRGRPAKSHRVTGTGKRIYPQTEPCLDCGALRTKSDNPRCHPCAMAKRKAEAHERYRKVAHVLSDAGRPLTSHEIAFRMNCSQDAVKNLVMRARRLGVPITSEGRRYRLTQQEVAS